MKDLLDWAKAHAKPDANVAEFEELAKKYAIPETKETAWDFMQKTPAFKSAMDAEVSRAVAAHDERYKASELPKFEQELRKKINDEQNKPKTPLELEVEQMKREREEEKAAIAKERRVNALLKKASEKGFNADIAVKLADLGDGAEEILVLIAETMSAQVKTQYEEIARKKLGGSTPEGRTATNRDLSAEYADAEKRGDGTAMLRIKAEMRAAAQKE